MQLDHFERAAGAEMVVTRWANGANGGPAGAGFGGACAALDADNEAEVPTDFGVVAPSNDDGVSSRAISVCFDVGAATGDEVQLADAEVLDASSLDPEDGFQLISDRQNDRLLAVATRDLLCRDCTDVSGPVLADQLLSLAIDVGREPAGMTRSALLACPLTGPERTPVVLVANVGSSDVSVIAIDASGLPAEIDVVPLPETVVGFLDDADGPDCADPFAWAIGEEGRLFPIDMRGVAGVPLCDGVACSVSTRGRGMNGAVGRPATGPMAGRARALVGGPGLLGELGFFRPQALVGAGYSDGSDFAEGSRPPDD
jgi:hypothetical protein